MYLSIYLSLCLYMKYKPTGILPECDSGRGKHLFFFLTRHPSSFRLTHPAPALSASYILAQRPLQPFTSAPSTRSASTRQYFLLAFSIISPRYPAIYPHQQRFTMSKTRGDAQRPWDQSSLIRSQREEERAMESIFHSDFHLVYLTRISMNKRCIFLL